MLFKPNTDRNWEHRPVKWLLTYSSTWVVVDGRRLARDDPTIVVIVITSGRLQAQQSTHATAASATVHARLPEFRREQFRTATTNRPLRLAACEAVALDVYAAGQRRGQRDSIWTRVIVIDSSCVKHAALKTVPVSAGFASASFYDVHLQDGRGRGEVAGPPSRSLHPVRCG